MRLFVAINMPASERELVRRATRGLRESRLPVRWVESDAYHVTLKFLGEVPDPMSETVAAAVCDVASRNQTFGLRFRGAGVFPAQGQPTVWWIGIEPSPELAGLQRMLEAALAPLGFPPERRPFSPHLTLGRTRRDAAPAALRGAGPLLQEVAHDRTITVESLDLMRSYLSPTGASYECLCAASLRP